MVFKIVVSDHFKLHRPSSVSISGISTTSFLRSFVRSILIKIRISILARRKQRTTTKCGMQSQSIASRRAAVMAAAMRWTIGWSRVNIRPPPSPPPSALLLCCCCHFLFSFLIVGYYFYIYDFVILSETCWFFLVCCVPLSHGFPSHPIRRSILLWFFFFPTAATRRCSAAAMQCQSEINKNKNKSTTRVFTTDKRTDGRECLILLCSVVTSLHFTAAALVEHWNKINGFQSFDVNDTICILVIY